MGEINNEKIIRIPKKDKKLAEFIGIILGDGHIGKTNYNITITGNSETDYDYLVDYVKPLMEILFGVKAFIRQLSNERGMQVTIQGVRIFRFLKSLDLIPGNKIRNNVSIPKWIFSKKTYLKACIRGLIDTDGGVYLCGNGTKFPRIGFHSNIPNLRKSFMNALLILDYHPLNWVQNKKTAIYRKDDVFRYMEEIGFNNIKHLNRFNQMNSC